MEQHTTSLEEGMLYLCATPIGNLEDITLRVLRVLQEADVIYCEDTRNTLKLLRHFEIVKPLQSYHDHSPEARAQKIADDVRAGRQVALVSDAGMPVISDPGFDLVNLFRRENLPYTVLPGASASLTALVLSGIAADRFLFEGFLPRKKKDLEARLVLLDKERATAIIYESPHRLSATLDVFAKRWPERECAAVREITKRFEETVRGTTVSVRDHFNANAPRGEFVLILGGAVETETSAEDAFAQGLALAKQLIQDGASTNQAAKEAAQTTGLSKRTIYQALLADQ
ncbi:MAG: 16S rRNA (cytidine(1402)-2'-O)-methyltransferase [Peptococcaceae bacterium]|nr:16S rRNA (cytidine(1402)-2'-O)-methyltransferase [Peptococcaceae bacterium]